MREQIFSKALELFLRDGIKTTTMDDIASEMAISKKTIYQHYESKNKLIDGILVYTNTLIATKIQGVFDKKGHPIDEILNIYDILLTNSLAFQFELAKYYPKIYQKQKKTTIKKTLPFIEENLENGIKKGSYKKDIDVELFARFFIASCYQLDDADLFPLDQFNPLYLHQSSLQFYIESIATDWGIQHFNTMRNM